MDTTFKPALESVRWESENVSVGFSFEFRLGGEMVS